MSLKMQYNQIIKFILFACILLPDRMNSQNLVPNAGFEIFDKCPDNYLLTDRKMLVPGWYIPTGSTPDYFNSCTRVQVGVPENYMGYCLAKDGKPMPELFYYSILLLIHWLRQKKITANILKLN